MPAQAKPSEGGQGHIGLDEILKSVERRHRLEFPPRWYGKTDLRTGASPHRVWARPVLDCCAPTGRHSSAQGEALSVDLWVLHEGSVPKDRAIVAASAWLVKPHHACMFRCILQPGRHFEPCPRRRSNRAAATGRVLRAVP